MQRPPFLHRYNGTYSVLAVVSNCYPQLPGRSSTRYSPVRHFTRTRRPFHVRLACVRHAASVQSEPESNSPVENMILVRLRGQLNSKLINPKSLFICQRTAASQRGLVSLCFSLYTVNSFFPLPEKFPRRHPEGKTNAAIARGVASYLPFYCGCQEVFKKKPLTHAGKTCQPFISSDSRYVFE